MDYLEDIKKCAKQPVDQDVIAQMEKTYALVLSKPDSRLVSVSDAEEVKTVRENFLKKKLGVTGSDEELDATIVEIGKQIPGQKNRLTVYYLLAEHYGKLSVFK